MSIGREFSLAFPEDDGDEGGRSKVQLVNAIAEKLLPSLAKWGITKKEFQRLSEGIFPPASLSQEDVQLPIRELIERALFLNSTLFFEALDVIDNKYPVYTQIIQELKGNGELFTAEEEVALRAAAIQAWRHHSYHNPEFGKFVVDAKQTTMLFVKHVLEQLQTIDVDEGYEDLAELGIFRPSKILHQSTFYKIYDSLPFGLQLDELPFLAFFVHDLQQTYLNELEAFFEEIVQVKQNEIIDQLDSLCQVFCGKFWQYLLESFSENFEVTINWQQHSTDQTQTHELIFQPVDSLTLDITISSSQTPEISERVKICRDTQRDEYMWFFEGTQIFVGEEWIDEQHQSAGELSSEQIVLNNFCYQFNWGMDMFDSSSYRPGTQLWFNPKTRYQVTFTEELQRLKKIIADCSDLRSVIATCNSLGFHNINGNINQIFLKGVDNFGPISFLPPSDPRPN